MNGAATTTEFDWLPDIDYVYFMSLALRTMVASGDAPLSMLDDENAPEWEKVRDKAEELWKKEQ